MRQLVCVEYLFEPGFLISAVSFKPNNNPLNYVLNIYFIGEVIDGQKSKWLVQVYRESELR